MSNKNKARTGGTVTGLNAKNVSDLQGKDNDFPHEIPENTDLNNLEEPQQVAAETQPEKDKKRRNNSQGLIFRIETYLNSRYSFRYNIVKNAVEILPKGQTKWSELDERQAIRIEAELLRTGFNSIGRTLHVFLSSARDFNPISDYLDTLPVWDGQTDYIEQLAGFVDIDKERRTWFNRMFKKHLVRCLACATGQIPFNKQCFVFVSGQNDGKTSFLRFVCPPAWNEYYTEDIDFENKDGLIALARNIFINLDELRNLSRQDINKVKSYLSKDQIKARLPFDRRETKLRRHASFFGSTNNAEFLTDETGNVRWLVFEIKGILHDNGGPEGYGAKVDINKVYSQAFALLKSDFYFQLTKEEMEQSEMYNRAHLVKPAEYDLILKYYDVSTDPKDLKTPAEIALNLQIKSFSKVSYITVGKAARMLGLARQFKKVKGQTIYGYYLKEIEELQLGKLEDENDDLPNCPFYLSTFHLNR